MNRNHVRFSRSIGLGAALVLASLAGGPSVLAHSPFADGVDLTDWCFGAPSNLFVAGARVEDSYIELICGNCTGDTNRRCRIDSDCIVGETDFGPCIDLTSNDEQVWWDNRQDGAVNDLATVATTQDAANFHWVAQLWVDPDPRSFPFGQIAIDFTDDDGVNAWYDPRSVLRAPGHCNVSTDRGCTINLPPYDPNADCHFCTMENEFPPSNRPRTCGTACDPDIPGNVCDTSQTCINEGAGLGLTQGLGIFSNPTSGADFLILFDFSIWFGGGTDTTHLFFNNNGSWEPAYNRAGVRLTADPGVDPGLSGGSGGPPGAVEVSLPWSFFGPDCGSLGGGAQCPQGFGPDVDFQWTMLIARGNSTFDWTPDGAIEDVMSEKVAGTTTASPNSCDNPDPTVPSAGTFQNTICEIADGSTDAIVPPPVKDPGGTTARLLMSKGAGAEVTLMWNPSCSVGDTDYGVYEGTVANVRNNNYDHAPVGGTLCSTGGMALATFNASAGDQYYLVVPTDTNVEGSYGQDSAAVERPASTTPCVPQQTPSSCP